MARKINWKNKTIVVKVGSSTLIRDSQINSEFLDSFVEEIAKARKEGFEVLIVTSGAVAIGMSKLKLKEKTLSNQQAASAVGQSFLMHIYNTYFEKHGFVTSQFLVNRNVFQSEALASDLKSTLSKVKGAIPIFNENDAIYSQGLAGFFDNDMLSADLSVLLNADLLVIVSEVDGLHTADPLTNSSAKRVEFVEEIKQEHMDMASGKSLQGRGGMAAKLNAIKYAASNGVTTVLTAGTNKNFLSRVIKGEELGTIFTGKKNGSA